MTSTMSSDGSMPTPADRPLPRNRGLQLGGPLLAACVGSWPRRTVVLAAAFGLFAATVDAASAHADGHLAPVGIVSATGREQAAVLTEMHVTGHIDIAGYRYYQGTIAGRPVVDVAGGEKDESAELATWLLDTTFHPRATLFSGTAGAQNAAINVGDVTLAGYVVDKSDIHYQAGGYQTAYSGIEIHNVGDSNIAGAMINDYGDQYPTPSNASTYKATTDKNWVFVSAFTGSRQLVTTGAKTTLGSTTVADATGDAKATGTVANKVVVGAIGAANVWTEPLSWIEAQNMLFQTDAEENEGSGFAYANAAAGVPWTLVRGISDTPWYPDAYDPALASANAARTVAYLVAHLPGKVSHTPVTTADLSPLANARTAGYLIADQAYFTVSPVTKVSFTTPNGSSKSLTGSALASLTSEYTFGAVHLK
jgi:adenosylhomocysteine nucleosidase